MNMGFPCLSRKYMPKAKAEKRTQSRQATTISAMATTAATGAAMILAAA